MKSLNDVLWDKDDKEGESREKDTYAIGMRDTCLTDNCACAYVSDSPWSPHHGFQKMCN